jgi:hypothetical protein
MLIPSTLALVVGALLTATIVAMDWFVWGLNLASDPRQPRHPQPLTGLELLDLGLSRLLSVSQATLPKAALEPALNHASGSDPDEGFKRVA